MGRLSRETDRNKDDRGCPGQRQVPAPKALAGLYATGQESGRITPIHMPSTPPISGPTEHIRDAAKNNIANPRALAPQNTFAAFTAHITNRTSDHDFEHLTITPSDNDFV